MQEATGSANARHLLRALYNTDGVEYGGCTNNTVRVWLDTTTIPDAVCELAAEWDFIIQSSTNRKNCWDWTDGLKLTFEYDNG